MESTAIIIHALSSSKPRGWEIAVRKARCWLVSQQTDHGHWDEVGGHPNVTFLTVLVLDAIALIDGQTNVTFSIPKLPGDKKVESKGEEKTFRKKFTNRERMTAWDKEFGPDIDRTKCPICKRNEISRENFAMGHKKSLANNGTNSLRNIRPICFQCNTMMGTMNMADYIKKYSPKTK